MSALKLSSFALAAFFALLFGAPARAQDDQFAKFGMYVVSSDLERAGAFYEKLFQKPPYVTNPGLIGFDVAGGLYAIVAQQEYAPHVVRGENAVPYIRVRDVDAEFARVKALSPQSLRTAAVVKDGPISLFTFADPDGNLIEFFSLTAPPPG